MSLLLFLLYWIAIPGLVIGATALLWRRIFSPVAKGLLGVTCAAILAGLLWFAEGEKWLLDREVRSRCAADGGVRVYETVELPADRFDPHGRPLLRIPNLPFESRRMTDEYYLKIDVLQLKAGNPSLSRRHATLVRSSDAKVMGESVSYHRRGGDLPGPWHESSFSCPDPGARKGLESSIFLKRDKQ